MNPEDAGASTIFRFDQCINAWTLEAEQADQMMNEAKRRKTVAGKQIDTLKERRGIVDALGRMLQAFIDKKKSSITEKDIEEVKGNARMPEVLHYFKTIVQDTLTEMLAEGNDEQFRIIFHVACMMKNNFKDVPCWGRDPRGGKQIIFCKSCPACGMTSKDNFRDHRDSCGQHTVGYAMNLSSLDDFKAESKHEHSDLLRMPSVLDMLPVNFVHGVLGANTQ